MIHHLEWYLSPNKVLPEKVQKWKQIEIRTHWSTSWYLFMYKYRLNLLEGSIFLATLMVLTKKKGIGKILVLFPGRSLPSSFCFWHFYGLLNKVEYIKLNSNTTRCHTTKLEYLERGEVTSCGFWDIWGFRQNIKQFFRKIFIEKLDFFSIWKTLSTKKRNEYIKSQNFYTNFVKINILLTSMKRFCLNSTFCSVRNVSSSWSFMVLMKFFWRSV